MFHLIIRRYKYLGVALEESLVKMLGFLKQFPQHAQTTLAQFIAYLIEDGATHNTSPAYMLSCFSCHVFEFLLVVFFCLHSFLVLTQSFVNSFIRSFIHSFASVLIRMWLQGSSRARR